MKTTVRRRVAATTAGALAATASITASLAFAAPAGAAGDADPEPVRTGFAYQAHTSATRLVTDGLEPLALRLGATRMPCTSYADRPARTASVLPAQIEEALPQELRDVVDVGVLRTSSRSFTAAGGRVHGTEGVSDLASISLGGVALPGFGTLPRLQLSGLSSRAVAKHTRGAGYSATTAFGLAGFDLDLGDNPVTPQLQPIVDLLEEVEAGTAALAEVVALVRRTLLTDGRLTIPGLGHLELQGRQETVDRNSATAVARQVLFVVDPDGAEGDHAPTSLQLGRAGVQVTGPVYDSVFRSYSVPLSLQLLDAQPLTLRSGTTSVIPCHGTVVGGRGWDEPVVQEHAASRVLTELGLVSVSGARSVFRGQHVARGKVVRGVVTRRPWSRATMRTVVDRFELGFADFAVEDLDTVVEVSTRRPTRSADGVRSFVQRADVTGRVRIGDTVRGLPAVGETLEFDFPGGGQGFLTRLASGANRVGRSFKPLQLRLVAPGVDVVTMTIGEATVFVSPRA